VQSIAVALHELVINAASHDALASTLLDPSSLLSYAADVLADFIVTGGYGHSRLREFILGGDTRGLL